MMLILKKINEATKLCKLSLREIEKGIRSYYKADLREVRVRCRRWIASGLVACMLLLLMPSVSLSVWGAEVHVGGFKLSTIDAVDPINGSDYEYDLFKDVLTILSSKPMIIKNISTTETNDRIVIGDNITANLTFDDVKITIDEDKDHKDSPLKINASSTLNLTLAKGSVNRLVCVVDDYAGIYVPSGATLTIDGMGSLYAQGGENASGIGGKSNNSGAVIIADGMLTVNGGYGGAGIGGGDSCDGGVVTVSGGTVIANGGEYAAGIGGGYAGFGGTMIVTGGTVVANGGRGAAGIGGGMDGFGGVVYVTSGTIIAKKGAQYNNSGVSYYVPADISAGANVNCDTALSAPTVRITGGLINASIQRTSTKI